MVLGKLSVPRRPTNLDNSRARAIALAVGAGGGCLDIFKFIYLFSFLSPSFGDGPIQTEICLKGPLNPKKLTDQIQS